MKRAIFAALCAALSVGLGACGGTPSPPRSTSPTTPKLLRGPQSCIPKEGAGVPGVCVQKRRLSLLPTRYLRGPFVPDVSYYQGHPDWLSAKREISGAIVRVADGNFNDPAFAYNWHELRRLHIWHATYFFLRPGDCAAEARRGIALVNAQGGFDSGPLIADAEVPLPYGCVAAFVEEARRKTGLPGIVYTAPGTYPGGPHGNAVLWVATYGSEPGCVWTCAHVAWQYTDGKYGPLPHCIVGIGCDDISTDNGITRLGRHPTPRPVDRKALKARQRALRRVLLHFGCRRRVKVHERLGPRCRRWFAEGDRIARILG